MGLPRIAKPARARVPFRPRVLIVGSPGDAHAEAVGASLRRRGSDPELLDLADVPRLRGVCVGQGPTDAWTARFSSVPADTVVEAGWTSVWWRRPRPYVPHETLSAEHREFALEQIHEAVVGIWESLDVAWVNPPWSDQRASNKVTQLALARELGWDLPRTLVTTSEGEAKAFLDRLGGATVVHKTLASGGRRTPPTRFLTPRDLDRLADLRFSPVLLQEYVPGIDVRVTVVGRSCFAAEIDARRSSCPQDFREAQDQCRFSPTVLSRDEESRIHRMMDLLGLVYGAFDFRRASDGRLVFLEVNPAGQWLFVERRTGQPISDALAAILHAGAGLPSRILPRGSEPLPPPAGRPRASEWVLLSQRSCPSAFTGKGR